MATAPAVDGVVLVHGGTCAADIWDEVMPLLDFPAVAVDLPGRGSNPADLATVTLADCVAAVIDAADRAGFRRMALVGHSLGGVTITETAMCHPDRVLSVIYLAALVPTAHTTAARLTTGSDMPDGRLSRMPEEISKTLFANDLDEAQWASVRARLVDDTSALLNARVRGLPLHAHRVYIDCTEDVPVPPSLVEAMLPALGACVTRRTLEAGHMVMNSQPVLLARTLAELICTG